MPRILILSNPESGSSLLRDILNSHPDFYFCDEILEEVNVKNDIDPILQIEAAFSESNKHFVGINCFPEQLLKNSLGLQELIERLAINHLIVLWRESVLESFTSEAIANNSGYWYQSKLERNSGTLRVKVCPTDVHEFYEERVSEWLKMGDHWATSLEPIFIRFEEFVLNPNVHVEKILAKLSCTKKNLNISTNYEVQKLESRTLEDKIVNFMEIHHGNLKELKLDVQKLIAGNKITSISDPEIFHLAPDKEPCMPSSSWTYRVASPFIPTKVKQNVRDAIESGHVSSAGYWGIQLAQKLKEFFGVPVAQPCSNGYSALFLAMQASGKIGKDDEVIMPSMTMIADPNAVHFLGAKPVFADCAKDNFNPDLAEILKVVTNKTKAVILTHTYGVPTPDLEEIVKVCKTNGWLLIEDISQCFGVKVRVKVRNENQNGSPQGQNDGVVNQNGGEVIQNGCNVAQNSLQKIQNVGSHILNGLHSIQSGEETIQNGGEIQNGFHKIQNDGEDILNGYHTCHDGDEVMQHTGLGIESDDQEVDKLLGTFGDFACASMYVNKIVHAGDGGFVIAKNPKYSIILTSLVNHGFTPSFHFVHFEPATNSKINGVGAAIAAGCIDEIKAIMTHREFVARKYREHLKPCTALKLMPQCGPYDTPWVFGVTCPSKFERTELRAYLAANGIETRDFFFALHLQPAYRKTISEGQRLPNAELLGSTSFYLPTHSNLTEADIQFICAAVREFYGPSSDGVKGQLVPPPQTPFRTVQVIPDSFSLEVREFERSGELTRSQFMDHYYLDAVSLGIDAQDCLIHERWDNRQSFLRQAKSCIEKAKEENDESIQKYLQPFISYFESQIFFEPLNIKPWENVDLKASDDLRFASTIPTTTDEETLKLLVWLVRESKPNVIWEIGSWFGGATALMATAGNGHVQKIFACDAFLWQNWMDNFADKTVEFADGQSFKVNFVENTSRFGNVIEAIDWDLETPDLPHVLTECQNKPDLIFLDFTQEDGELEEIWKIILPQLNPGKTIILFNGLCSTSIAFFTRHAHELISMAKPNTIAKLFKFMGQDHLDLPETDADEEPDMKQLLPRRLNFQSNPGWDHHHKNLFCASIQLLKDKLHDPNAKILFTPAVEEKLCDEPELYVKNPWIGIVHSVPDYPEYFYPPDMRRLCSPAYSKVMKNCKGLFTLTEFQAGFLRENLQKEYCFPIQPLLYPIQVADESSVSEMSYSQVPTSWKNGEKIKLALIGSFARDFDYFYNVEMPSNVQKILLATDEYSLLASKRSPPAPSVEVVTTRLNDEEYEDLLRNSIPFISLKYEGAANTVIVECIQRNVPIVAPRMASCAEYLGENYPLLYEPKTPSLKDFITLEKIEEAISYLTKMNKSRFHPENFIKTVENGAAMLGLPPIQKTEASAILDLSTNAPTDLKVFDVTICICSYKRTHNLAQILETLFKGQDFPGTLEIIIWNNNEGRAGTVADICDTYLKASDSKRSLQIINSTKNHFCSVRFAMPALMRSNCLLICDDDIFPGSNFVSFYMSAHKRHPQDVLCVRGHKFYEHSLDLANPVEVWHEYDNLKFYGDEDPEKFIHFVHSDACLIPKSALVEVMSVDMPSPEFILVDDYWMSFVLNHYFGRKLRKLSIGGINPPPLKRAKDSDTVGLALYTRPEVQDARTQLYIHHMLKGWPSWKIQTETNTAPDWTALKSHKTDFWNAKHFGYNISSRIDVKGIQDLVKTGVDCVRIGAVGVGREIEFEFQGFLEDPERQLNKLEELVKQLSLNNLSVILTLERRLVSVDTWKLIAERLAKYPNVVGYDLINEPVTPGEQELHWAEINSGNDGDLAELMSTYKKLILAVREVDPVTPIIVEPNFWGNIDALNNLPIKELLQIESNLIVSFHFYEPMLLTQRDQNKSRYKFPGIIPVYDEVEYSETINWTPEYIHQKFEETANWAKKEGVKIFLGEFGICRDVEGSAGYLNTIFETLKKLEMTGMLFSFRDDDWEAMDYELGVDYLDINVDREWTKGHLMQTVLNGIKD